jgi:hypothetical protein
MSRNALRYYEACDCYDCIVDLYCVGSFDERIDTVLTSTYNETSLGATFLNIWLGMLWSARLSENFNHGAKSWPRPESPTKYREEGERTIEGPICDGHVDRLMLLWSHFFDHDILEVIRGVFDAGRSTKAWESYSARSRRAEEHMFAAARRSAQKGRFGMMTGFDACIWPESCEQAND